MNHLRYMGRGEAVGVVISAMFTAPLFTLLATLVVGWWGLLVYPVALVGLLAMTNYDLKEKARRWDTNE